MEVGELVGFEARMAQPMPYATRPGPGRDKELGNLFIELVRP
jgi:hypothetical protein